MASAAFTTIRTGSSAPVPDVQRDVFVTQCQRIQAALDGCDFSVPGMPDFTSTQDGHNYQHTSEAAFRVRDSASRWAQPVPRQPPVEQGKDHSHQGHPATSAGPRRDLQRPVARPKSARASQQDWTQIDAESRDALVSLIQEHARSELQLLPAEPVPKVAANAHTSEHHRRPQRPTAERDAQQRPDWGVRQPPQKQKHQAEQHDESQEKPYAPVDTRPLRERYAKPWQKHMKRTGPGTAEAPPSADNLPQQQATKPRRERERPWLKRPRGRSKSGPPSNAAPGNPHGEAGAGFARGAVCETARAETHPVPPGATSEGQASGAEESAAVVEPKAGLHAPSDEVAVSASAYAVRKAMMDTLPKSSEVKAPRFDAAPAVPPPPSPAPPTSAASKAALHCFMTRKRKQMNQLMKDEREAPLAAQRRKDDVRRTEIKQARVHAQKFAEKRPATAPVNVVHAKNVCEEQKKRLQIRKEFAAKQREAARQQRASKKEHTQPAGSAPRRDWRIGADACEEEDDEDNSAPASPASWRSLGSRTSFKDGVTNTVHQLQENSLKIIPPDDMFGSHHGFWRRQHSAAASLAASRSMSRDHSPPPPRASRAPERVTVQPVHGKRGAQGSAAQPCVARRSRTRSRRGRAGQSRSMSHSADVPHAQTAPHPISKAAELRKAEAASDELREMIIAAQSGNIDRDQKESELEVRAARMRYRPTVVRPSRMAGARGAPSAQRPAPSLTGSPVKKRPREKSAHPAFSEDRRPQLSPRMRKQRGSSRGAVPARAPHALGARPVHNVQKAAVQLRSKPEQVVTIPTLPVGGRSQRPMSSPSKGRRRRKQRRGQPVVGAGVSADGEQQALQTCVKELREEDAMLAGALGRGNWRCALQPAEQQHIAAIQQALAALQERLGPAKGAQIADASTSPAMPPIDADAAPAESRMAGAVTRAHGRNEELAQEDLHAAPALQEDAPLTRQRTPSGASSPMANSTTEVAHLLDMDRVEDGGDMPLSPQERQECSGAGEMQCDVQHASPGSACQPPDDQGRVSMEAYDGVSVLPPLAPSGAKPPASVSNVATAPRPEQPHNLGPLNASAAIRAQFITTGANLAADRSASTSPDPFDAAAPLDSKADEAQEMHCPDGADAMPQTLTLIEPDPHTLPYEAFAAVDMYVSGVKVQPPERAAPLWAQALHKSYLQAAGAAPRDPALRFDTSIADSLAAAAAHRSQYHSGPSAAPADAVRPKTQQRPDKQSHSDSVRMPPPLIVRPSEGYLDAIVQAQNRSNAQSPDPSAAQPADVGSSAAQDADCEPDAWRPAAVTDEMRQEVLDSLPKFELRPLTAVAVQQGPDQPRAAPSELQDALLEQLRKWPQLEDLEEQLHAVVRAQEVAELQQEGERMARALDAHIELAGSTMAQQQSAIDVQSSLRTLADDLRRDIGSEMAAIAGSVSRSYAEAMAILRDGGHSAPQYAVAVQTEADLTSKPRGVDRATSHATPTLGDASDADIEYEPASEAPRSVLADLMSVRAERATQKVVQQLLSTSIATDAASSIASVADDAVSAHEDEQHSHLTAAARRYADAVSPVMSSSSARGLLGATQSEASEVASQADSHVGASMALSVPSAVSLSQLDTAAKEAPDGERLASWFVRELEKQRDEELAQLRESARESADAHAVRIARVRAQRQQAGSEAERARLDRAIAALANDATLAAAAASQRETLARLSWDFRLHAWRELASLVAAQPSSGSPVRSGVPRGQFPGVAAGPRNDAGSDAYSVSYIEDASCEVPETRPDADSKLAHCAPSECSTLDESVQASTVHEPVHESASNVPDAASPVPSASHEEASLGHEKRRVAPSAMRDPEIDRLQASVREKEAALIAALQQREASIELQLTQLRSSQPTPDPGGAGGEATPAGDDFIPTTVTHASATMHGNTGPAGGADRSAAAAGRPMSSTAACDVSAAESSVSDVSDKDEGLDASELSSSYSVDGTQSAEVPSSSVVHTSSSEHAAAVHDASAVSTNASVTSEARHLAAGDEGSQPLNTELAGDSPASEPGTLQTQVEEGLEAYRTAAADAAAPRSSVESLPSEVSGSLSGSVSASGELKALRSDAAEGDGSVSSDGASESTAPSDTYSDSYDEPIRDAATAAAVAVTQRDSAQAAPIAVQDARPTGPSPDEGPAQGSGAELSDLEASIVESDVEVPSSCPVQTSLHDDERVEKVAWTDGRSHLTHDASEGAAIEAVREHADLPLDDEQLAAEAAKGQSEAQVLEIHVAKPIVTDSIGQPSAEDVAGPAPGQADDDASDSYSLSIDDCSVTASRSRLSLDEEPSSTRVARALDDAVQQALDGVVTESLMLWQTLAASTATETTPAAADAAVKAPAPSSDAAGAAADAGAESLSSSEALSVDDLDEADISIGGSSSDSDAPSQSELYNDAHARRSPGVQDLEPALETKARQGGEATSTSPVDAAPQSANAQGDDFMTSGWGSDDDDWGLGLNGANGAALEDDLEDDEDGDEFGSYLSYGDLGPSSEELAKHEQEQQLHEERMAELADKLMRAREEDVKRTQACAELALDLMLQDGLPQYLDASVDHAAEQIFSRLRPDETEHLDGEQPSPEVARCIVAAAASLLRRLYGRLNRLKHADTLGVSAGAPPKPLPSVHDARQAVLEDILESRRMPVKQDVAGLLDLPGIFVPNCVQAQIKRHVEAVQRDRLRQRGNVLVQVADSIWDELLLDTADALQSVA